MPTLVRPPIPPRSYPGIPYHRLLHEELTEAIQRVIKGVLMQVSIEGLPDDRQIDILVDAAAPGLVLPPSLWELVRASETRTQIIFSLAPGTFRDLELLEEGFGARFQFAWAPPGEWREVGVPWAAILLLHDRAQEVVLQIPTRTELEKELGGEEAAGIARKLAEEAFRTLGEDEEETH